MTDKVLRPVTCFEKVKNWLHLRGKIRFAKPRQQSELMQIWKLKSGRIPFADLLYGTHQTSLKTDNQGEGFIQIYLPPLTSIVLSLQE